MGEGDHVDETLMDDELIRLCGHGIAIETIKSPEASGGFDADPLIGAGKFPRGSTTVEFKPGVGGERHGQGFGLFHVKHSIQAKKVSTLKRRISTATTNRKALRMKDAPWRSASAVPTREPRRLHTAIAAASFQNTVP